MGVGCVEVRGSTAPADASTPSCDALYATAQEIIETAAAEAPRACTRDADCTLYRRRPNCVFDCGFRAAVTSASSLDQAIDLTDRLLCPAQCVQEQSSCVGADASEAAICDGGQCRLAAARSQTR
jgi:hypothetical protein